MDAAALEELARERMVAALRRQHATVAATCHRGGDWVPRDNFLALDLVIGDTAAAAAAEAEVRARRGCAEHAAPRHVLFVPACDPARLVAAAREEQRLAEAALALGERPKPEVKGRGRKWWDTEKDLMRWQDTHRARKRLRAAPPVEDRVRAAADDLEDPHYLGALRGFLPLNPVIQTVCWDRQYGVVHGIHPLLVRAREAVDREHARDYAYRAPPALAVLAARAIERMLKPWGHRAEGEHLDKAQWRACLPRAGELAAACVEPDAVEARYRNSGAIHAFLEAASAARRRLRLPRGEGLPALTPPVPPVHLN
jgi:hypothetical protein